MQTQFAICDLRQVTPSGREYPLSVEDIRIIERGLSMIVSDLEGTDAETLVDQAKALKIKLKSLFELMPQT
jgi:hypothetical protein